MKNGKDSFFLLSSRRLILIVHSALLVSCVTTLENVPKSYSVAEARESGLMVASFRIQWPADYFSWYLRHLDTRKTYKLTVMHMEPHWFSKTRILNRLSVVALPEGMYELYSFEAIQEMGSSTRELTPLGGLSLKFTITRGKAVYIGNINVNINMGLRANTGALDRLVLDPLREGILGKSGELRVAVSDERTSDLELLSKDYSFIKPEDVDVELVK